MKATKPIKAWAVVDRNEQIDLDTIEPTKGLALWHVGNGAGYRVMPVLITPIAKVKP